MARIITIEAPLRSLARPRSSLSGNSVSGPFDPRFDFGRAVPETLAVLRAAGIETTPVIAAGGIRTLADIRRLQISRPLGLVAARRGLEALGARPPAGAFLPAVARIELHFGVFFHVPLAALHLSLVMRLGFGFFDEPLRAIGATFNGVAIALFAATVADAAVAWRVNDGAPGARESI